MRFLILFVFLGTLTAYAEIQFVGTSLLDGRQQFALLDTDTQNTGWAAVGETFAGFTLESYKSDEQVLTLRNGDSVQHLKIQTYSPKTDQPVAQPQPEYYTLRPGDTGLKVAREYNISLQELLALNPDVTFNRLKVGQKLRVK